MVVSLVVCVGLRLDGFLDEEDFGFGTQRNRMDWILPVHIALEDCTGLVPCWFRE